MQKNIENKAMQPEDVENKAADSVQKELWQFNGDGKKPPITIEADSQEQAIELYEKYLNS